MKKKFTTEYVPFTPKPEDLVAGVRFKKTGFINDNPHLWEIVREVMHGESVNGHKFENAYGFFFARRADNSNPERLQFFNLIGLSDFEVAFYKPVQVEVVKRKRSRK